MSHFIQFHLSVLVSVCAPQFVREIRTVRLNDHRRHQRHAQTSLLNIPDAIKIRNSILLSTAFTEARQGEIVMIIFTTFKSCVPVDLLGQLSLFEPFPVKDFRLCTVLAHLLG